MFHRPVYILKVNIILVFYILSSQVWIEQALILYDERVTKNMDFAEVLFFLIHETHNFPQSGYIIYDVT